MLKLTRKWTRMSPKISIGKIIETNLELSIYGLLNQE